MLRDLLSEEIKTKVDDVSENYSKIKAQLISDYGSASRIVSYIMVGLAGRKKPLAGNKRERYQFYVNLTKAVS